MIIEHALQLLVYTDPRQNDLYRRLCGENQQWQYANRASKTFVPQPYGIGENFLKFFEPIDQSKLRQIYVSRLSNDHSAGT